MTKIARIIWLNKMRKEALREHDVYRFNKYSCRIHKIEHAERIPIGSYILK